MSIAADALPREKAVDPGWMRWVGFILSGLPSLLFAFSAYMNLTRAPMLVQGLVKYGFSAGVALPLGIVELASLVLYVIPNTAVLGALLLTGYLGGAVATHVRAGEPLLMPVMVGVLVWGGLFLRDVRIRALLPWRQLGQ